MVHLEDRVGLCVGYRVRKQVMIFIPDVAGVGVQSLNQRLHGRRLRPRPIVLARVFNGVFSLFDVRVVEELVVEGDGEVGVVL